MIGRLLLPGEFIVHSLLAVAVVASPFGGLTYVIWADPLCYTLFIWVIYGTIRFYRNPGVINAGVLAALLALLFNAKPGTGLVIQIATVASMVVFFANAPNNRRRQLWRPMGALLILTTLLTAPAVVRNLYLGAGPIGYRYASLELTQRIAELGQLRIAEEISISIFYQLSYVFIGSWGLLGVLITLSILRWNRFSGELQACVAFVISAIGGLIAMSAVGNQLFWKLKWAIIVGAICYLDVYAVRLVPGASKMIGSGFAG